MPWNVGGQAERFGGKRGIPELNVPKNPGTTGYPLPFGVGKSQGQGVKETEGQVLPFPQLVSVNYPPKEHQCQARLPVQGAPSILSQ